MSIRLLVEEMYCGPKRHWKIGRSLLLLIGVGALSYSGWTYVDQFIHERSERSAFDFARENQPSAPSETEGPVPVEPFRAKLVIGRLNLTTMVEEGVDEATLRHAAGHIPTTAMPGQMGNIGVAAHRDTLFRKLKDIKSHDQIALSTLTSEYNYEVTGTSVVRPNDISVLNPTPGEKTLTLVTCYPFYYVGPAPKRFVVQARQVSVTRP